MKRKELLQTLLHLYDELNKLHSDITNCVDISCTQATDLIDSREEIEEILRYMITELED